MSLEVIREVLSIMLSMELDRRHSVMELYMMANGNKEFLQAKVLSDGLQEKLTKGIFITGKSTEKESKFGQTGKNMTGNLRKIKFQGTAECNSNSAVKVLMSPETTKAKKM